MCFILTINGFFLDKIVIERQDCISIYGKGTLVKSVLIPTFVYISSLLPTPKEFVKELNQILFNFLWKGPDKVTRVSVINEYDKGGLKMTDVDSIVMSLRLAWLKRLFGGNDGFWKRYLSHLLEPYRGFFFFNAILISEITQTFLNFIPSFCNGGLNSEKCLYLKRIGFT